VWRSGGAAQMDGVKGEVLKEGIEGEVLAA
jgi:hypothetical protein